MLAIHAESSFFGHFHRRPWGGSVLSHGQRVWIQPAPPGCFPHSSQWQASRAAQDLRHRPRRHRPGRSEDAQQLHQCKVTCFRAPPRLPVQRCAGFKHVLIDTTPSSFKAPPLWMPSPSMYWSIVVFVLYTLSSFTFTFLSCIHHISHKNKGTHWNTLTS